MDIAHVFAKGDGPLITTIDHLGIRQDLVFIPRVKSWMSEIFSYFLWIFLTSTISTCLTYGIVYMKYFIMNYCIDMQL